MDGDGPFGAAASAVRAAGLPVYAWTALTHSSRLGDANPGAVVRNAFGDAYPYALCPSNEHVAEYARTLVSEVLELGRPDGVVLETCGPLGFSHGGHHEKTDGADWPAVQQKLLSLCFCAACADRYTDPVGLRDVLRAAIDAGAAGAAGVDEALGDRAEDVREVRMDISRALRRELVDLIRSTAPTTRVAVHATADPWGTGPFSTVAGGVEPTSTC